MRSYAVVGRNGIRIAEAKRILRFKIGDKTDRTDAGGMFKDNGEHRMRARRAREVVQPRGAAFAERTDGTIAVCRVAERTVR